MKNPLWGCSVILLFIYVTGTYQNTISENDEIITSTPASILREKSKCYTVDEANEFCSTFFSENGNSNERIDNADSEDDFVDLKKLLDEISDEKKNETLSVDDEIEIEVPTSTTWRTGTLESQNQYFLNSGRYSDITFEVGPDNNTQVIHAHKFLLVRGSPIFEKIINATSIAANKIIRYRISDINPNAFKTLLEFIYTGKLCFKSFDEACEMLNIAARFQMPDLAEYCHYHIWLHMYPKNLWSAYQCATRANDNTMAKAAMQVIQQKTDIAVTDPTFTSIPEHALIEFLKRESLNVSSELILYQAALRWAMAEATRRGLPQDPESLRECLGDALQHFRFLTLTPNEFANIQYTSKVLTYSESLAVIFNLNAPGVMPLPSNLSSNKNSRIFTKKNEHFVAYKKPTFSPNCKGTTIDLVKSENIFDMITSDFRLTDLNDLTIRSIKIPKPIDADCLQDQDFTIVFLGPSNNVMHNQKYSFNSCTNVNSKVYVIKLTEDINIPSSPDQRYTIKVVIHNTGVYPLSLGKGSIEKENHGSGYYYRPHYGNQYINMYTTKLGENSFVYSISNFDDSIIR